MGWQAGPHSSPGGFEGFSSVWDQDNHNEKAPLAAWSQHQRMVTSLCRMEMVRVVRPGKQREEEKRLGEQREEGKGRVP